MATPATPPPYRGRLAPSPTGHLHLGHARTFWTAQKRARQHGGTLILRNEDLDGPRCKPEFARAALEDLKWFDFTWSEGPDCGGAFVPYNQSERMTHYRAAFEQLKVVGFIYPCTCSRKDIHQSATAPHAEDGEPIYPGTCRLKESSNLADDLSATSQVNWRFRVTDGEAVEFVDGRCGLQRFVAGCDFGDFPVWRHDDLPSYQLAVVVDDAAMQITEVVRGEDMLLSTARQLLLYRALSYTPPAFYHCPLMRDEKGERLAKRHDALSLRTMRERGAVPEEVRRGWD